MNEMAYATKELRPVIDLLSAFGDLVKDRRIDPFPADAKTLLDLFQERERERKKQERKAERRYIAKQIKTARKERGLTQRQLAELIDVSADYLSKLERAWHSPSEESLQKLCEELGKPQRYFLPSGRDA